MGVSACGRQRQFCGGTMRRARRSGVSIGEFPVIVTGRSRALRFATGGRGLGLLAGRLNSSPITKKTTHMKIIKPTIKLWLCLAALPLGVFAQNPTSVPTPTTTPGTYSTTSGMHEVTFGAVGVSNKEMDDSFGGVNLSLGSYVSDTLEIVVRQSVNYSNPQNGGSAWNGSTRLALDENFGSGASVRPFLGVNFGGIYGDQVRDSFAAGIEGGAKFYIHPRTFVFLMAEYAWTFRHSSAINDRFDDGQFNWNAGIGFNF
jgi:hypothetical protein